MREGVFAQKLLQSCLFHLTPRHFGDKEWFKKVISDDLISYFDFYFAFVSWTHKQNLSNWADDSTNSFQEKVIHYVINTRI